MDSGNYNIYIIIIGSHKRDNFLQKEHEVTEHMHACAKLHDIINKLRDNQRQLTKYTLSLSES